MTEVSKNAQVPKCDKNAVSGSTYYISQNIVKTKKVKLKLPLYACVENENDKIYCKINEDFIHILKTGIYVNEVTFNRFRITKNQPIAEIWYNNQITEKEFSEVLFFVKCSLAKW